jgi:hypothetical protein
LIHEKNSIESQETENIFKEITLMHDDLFVVIYNRYFCNQIGIPPISWVNLDENEVIMMQNRAQREEERRVHTTV